ncbi:unnamed protein product [Mytilus coruscus]|uniref:Uncharacterized protein n=1 Tax=Mytilus coruscus TaxID=42192 RepID=A0A6J8ASZ1_MYTCO|nr:unnamed protein product [Mytilus coruscus]
MIRELIQSGKHLKTIATDDFRKIRIKTEANITKTVVVRTSVYFLLDVTSRVTQQEAASQGTGNLSEEIKSKTDTLASEIEHVQMERIDFENKQENMKEKIDTLEKEKREHKDEDCGDKLRPFLYHEMGIQQRLEFGNVHRFGKSYRDKPRPIIARFLYFSELAMVKHAGKTLNGTHYGVNQQFPVEIEEKRRKLYPIMKAERRNRSKVVLIRDKLYVNDELVSVANDKAS